MPLFHKRHLSLFTLFILLATLLAACGGQSEPVVIRETVVVEKEVEKEVEVVVEVTSTPRPRSSCCPGKRLAQNTTSNSERPTSPSGYRLLQQPTGTHPIRLSLPE